MKKISVSAIAAACLLMPLMGQAVSTSAKHKIVWLVGHRNLDFFEVAALKFKNTVESGSNGDIEVQILADGDPWQSEGAAGKLDIADRVVKGEAQMGHSFTNVLGKIDPRLFVFDCPYLMQGYTHMEGVIEGPIGPELLEGLRGQNIVGLAFTYSGGAQGVATVDKEIRGPEDLKGLKVGVYGSAIDSAWLTALGAQPVALKHDLRSFASNAEKGAIDAAVVTWRRARESHMRDRYKYVNLMNSSYLTSVTYINAEFFDSLPPKYQELVKTSALSAARIERARTIELNETSKNDLMADGTVPVFLSGAARAKFEKALRPVYEASLNGIVGKDLIERVRKTENGARLPSGFDFADPKNSFGRYPVKGLADQFIQAN